MLIERDFEKYNYAHFCLVQGLQSAVFCFFPFFLLLVIPVYLSQLKQQSQMLLKHILNQSQLHTHQTSIMIPT